MKTRLENIRPSHWVHIAAKAALEKKPAAAMRLQAWGKREFPKSKQILTTISMALILSVIAFFLLGFHYHQQIKTQRRLDVQDDLYNRHLDRYEKRIDLLQKQVKTRKTLESQMLAMMERYHSPLSQKERAAYVAFLIDEARRQDIAPSTALSLIAVESGFDPLAVSVKGAVGMAQLRPWVARSLAAEARVPWNGDKTLHDPFLNTRLGLYYLKTLLDRFGDLPTALEAYNQGPGALSRKMKNGGAFPNDYSKRVIALSSQLMIRSAKMADV